MNRGFIMDSWVGIDNIDELMTGYQKSSYDSTRMPGIGTYLKTIVDQNNEIIELLKKITNELRAL